MRIFLNPSTRVLEGAVPDGAISVPDVLAGDLEMDVSDDDWQGVYFPSWQAAQESGQDMVVHEDGSYTYQAHTMGEREIALATLNAFWELAFPTTDDQLAALKALLVVVRPLMQP